MEHHAGIDVSLERSGVCVIDATGRIVREAKVVGEPEALAAFLRGTGLALERVGLEAGPLSQGLHAGLRAAGRPAELIETRHAKAAISAMTNKTDRNDARGIAQLMRLGRYRPVHAETLPSQELRALLAARKLLVGKLRDLENSLRGILRGFGLKVGPVGGAGFLYLKQSHGPLNAHPLARHLPAGVHADRPGRVRGLLRSMGAVAGGEGGARGVVALGGKTLRRSGSRREKGHGPLVR